MPQYSQLASQKGSVLVGVLVLSLIMILAASGYLLSTNFTQAVEQVEKDDRKLQSAGETVAQMAVKYMRYLDPDALYGGASMANGTVTGITPAYPAFTDFQNISVRNTLGSPKIKAAYSKAVDTVSVLAWATFGGTTDTILISWKIHPTITDHYPLMSDLTMLDWKENILEYQP